MGRLPEEDAAIAASAPGCPSSGNRSRGLFSRTDVRPEERQAFARQLQGFFAEGRQPSQRCDSLLSNAHARAVWSRHRCGARVGLLGSAAAWLQGIKPRTWTAPEDGLHAERFCRSEGALRISLS